MMARTVSSKNRNFNADDDGELSSKEELDLFTGMMAKPVFRENSGFNGNVGKPAHR